MKSTCNPIQRRVAGFVGVAVGTCLMAAVTILFGDASSMVWLEPTPDNLVTMQRCDPVVGTAAHRACVEAVVTEFATHEPAPRVASVAPATTPRNPGTDSAPPPLR